jgi:hypothetical protein
MDEVRVATVPDELEAEQLCALLRMEGIDAYYTSQGGLRGLGETAGEYHVMVRAEDAERARELVDDGR